MLAPVKGAAIAVIDSKTASALVVNRHYLHRRPPISHAFGLYVGSELVGVVTYGTPSAMATPPSGAGCRR